MTKQEIQLALKVLQGEIKDYLEKKEFRKAERMVMQFQGYVEELNKLTKAQKFTMRRGELPGLFSLIRLYQREIDKLKGESE